MSQVYPPAVLILRSLGNYALVVVVVVMVVVKIHELCTVSFFKNILIYVAVLKCHVHAEGIILTIVVLFLFMSIPTLMLATNSLPAFLRNVFMFPKIY
jgi:hypothetical protein